MWDEQNPQTKCKTCKDKQLSCGPDEYKNENEQGKLEAIPDRGQTIRAEGGIQLLAPMPNRLVYTKEELLSR
jgi:hypothetical protein